MTPEQPPGRSVLVLTGDGIGPRMAGPAIRATNLARVLAADGHRVTLATTGGLAEFAPSGYAVTRIAPGDDLALRSLHDASQVIVLQGHAIEQFPLLRSTDRFLVVDAYDPMQLEMLEQGREQPRATWELLVRSRVELMNEQLAVADLVLCASARQRAFYLGQLASLGRLSPATYLSDPRLARLIALAPFGLDAEPPAPSDRPALRSLPGIEPEDRLLVWGGGLYSWFDPLTLIRAVAEVAEDDHRVKLVFLGTRHPGVEPMGIVKESIELADSLGVLGTQVVFNEGWVPYVERGGWLAEADAGVSTHQLHVETEFSFRTRILDYLWAGLPMVVTDGDAFADLVAAEGLGVVVPPGDQAALAAGIRRVLGDEDFRTAAAIRIAAVAETFVWERALQSLRDYVADPWHAADVVAAGGRARLPGAATSRSSATGLGHDLRMAWHYLRNGGPAEVLRRVRMRRERR